MPDVKRTVKLVTTQSLADPNNPPAEGELPLRSWTVCIYLVGPDGENLPAQCFEKATYLLHESFGKKAKQVIKQLPFRIAEDGWGEFEMQISLTPVGTSKADHTIMHDLNFQNEEYESTHQVTFRNPKPELLERLKDSAPAGEGVNGTTPAGGKSEKKRQKKAGSNVDMEKLAEGLPQLSEDDLLQVVQMVHDNKTEDTYTKNDVENGEFHVDLYTLPDSLIKMLWDFVEKRVAMDGM